MKKLLIVISIILLLYSPISISTFNNETLKFSYIKDDNILIHSNLDVEVKFNDTIYTVGNPIDMDYTSCDKSTFELYGKVWLVKIVLNESVDLFGITFDSDYNLNQDVQGHYKCSTGMYFKKEYWDDFGTFSFHFNYRRLSRLYPEFFHYHNNIFNYTYDNQKVDFTQGLWYKFGLNYTLNDGLSKGTHYLILWSQGSTLGNQEYDTTFNLSILYSKNSSIYIETKKQADPMGVSFSDMNANFIYWNYDDRFCLKNGHIVLNPNNTLFLSFDGGINLQLFKSGYFDLQIDDMIYYASKYNGQVTGDKFPGGLIILDKETIPVAFSCRLIKQEGCDSPGPIDLIAFDIDLDNI